MSPGGRLRPAGSGLVRPGQHDGGGDPPAVRQPVRADHLQGRRPGRDDAPVHVCGAPDGRHPGARDDLFVLRRAPGRLRLLELLRRRRDRLRREGGQAHQAGGDHPHRGARHRRPADRPVHLPHAPGDGAGPTRVRLRLLAQRAAGARDPRDREQGPHHHLRRPRRRGRAEPGDDDHQPATAVRRPLVSTPTLRSHNWFGKKDLDGFSHRSWIKAEGFSELMFDGRPVIGIANSWSELTNCNAHLRQVAEAVKRGVWSAGGFPLAFPTISLGEVLMKPTTMMFRNLRAMDVEECIRAYPLDAVVLLSGCDKTTPAMLMGAASADVPAIMVTGGPMLSGKWRTEELGSGTDLWRLWAERRAGRLTDEELCEAESCMSRSSGHCMVMGTASTMASMAEALGMTLSGNAPIPASDSRRMALAELSGRRAVEMALAGGPKPSEILTAKAFDNAIRADMAIGGSTTAVIPLVEIARRAGIDLPLRRFDELSRTTPLLVNVRPSGKYLMEDFFYAGGLPVVLKELLPLLHGEASTVAGT